MTKTIPLATPGKFAIVDDEDLEKVSQGKWYFRPSRQTGCAEGAIRRDGKRVRVSMHRFIAETPAGMETDHINGDGLDNRRANLRSATRLENMRNRRPFRGYKGVHFKKDRKVYQAYIKLEVKQKNLGYFVSDLAAACAYDREARVHYGDFARLNFPDGCPLTVEEVEALRYQQKKTSRFRGVSWNKRDKKWTASIAVSRKVVWRDHFESEMEAARAYNEAAIAHHGDKAKLNSI